ncbi:hypothetical protein B0H13DRAFT_1589586, partial [Mycena leptocephala]
CHGFEFSWNLDEIFDTYPFSIHRRGSRHDPEYTILSVDAIRAVIRVRATRCQSSVLIPGGGCRSCMGLGPSVDVVRDRALQPFGQKLTARLSRKEVEEKLAAVSKQLKNEQLKKADYFKSLKRARNRVKKHQEFFDLISTNIVPGLYRLLSNAKTGGWSIEKTSEMARNALQGKYHPRNYTEFDKDLAILIYELGGGAALHALNKAPIMLPSRHAIADIRWNHSLRITVGDVKISDILENIEMLFKNTAVGKEGRVLITLSQDKIAGGGRLCYLDDTDEIGGLCEHAIAELETLKMGSDLASVEAMATAVRENRVHVGKEFSVAAFARHAPSDYGAKPALLMPTCKKSNWKSSAKILQKLIQAWKISPYGEAMHGELTSIASDDDGGRRAALYLFLHAQETRPRRPHLFKRLYHSFLITSSLLKCFKGLCKLLCSKEGILVNGVVINKSLIAGWLERLTGHDWSDESIHALLNPKDPQDVPRAIKLLCLVAELRMAVDSSDFTPAERKTHRALSLLGEIFDALLEPFINPKLSLSEQLIHLVKFAHLICAMFVKHETAFLSNQLYGDLQCMVKNAIFKIAHSKVLNPHLKVFLCLLGDDVLETLFGRSRMIGGHSPNMAIDEFRQRVGSALRLDEIFRKYPWPERRARRLGMGRSRDVDHLTPEAWEGELTAGSCDIDACYETGVARAVAILRSHGCDIDFDALFAPEDRDLMRPKGGKYPGVSKEVDRSMVNSDSSPAEVEADTSAPSEVEEILNFDAKVALAAEKAARDAEQAAHPEPHSIWIELDGDERKKAHKKSDRLLRIRYFSIGGDHWDRAAAKFHANINDEHLLKLHGLFATLVSFDTSKVALAVLQCTLIKTSNTGPSNYLDAAPIAEIALPDTRYEITGLILSLVPFTNSPGTLSWAWTTDFVEFESAKAKRTSSEDAAARMHHLSIPVNGRFVIPLSSADLQQVSVEEILQMSVTNSTEPAENTWVFSTAQMDQMCSKLLERAKDEEIRLKIPVYGPVRKGRYPYQAVISNGGNETNHISYCLPSIQAPSPKDSRRKCRVCSKNIAAPDRQDHMGKHIILSMYGIQEENVSLPVASNYPCGFCGDSMTNGTCTIGIRSGNKATSTCSEAYKFAIKSASNSSGAHPCTNVPIRCILCQEVHWKYNMEQHLRDRHPEWELTKSRGERDAFSSTFAISESERLKLGVPETSPASPVQSEQSDALLNDSRGQKRLPTSPAGTPRHTRVLRVTHPAAQSSRTPTTRASTSVTSSSSEADVFTQ